VPVLFRAIGGEDPLAAGIRVNGFWLIELDLPALGTRYFPPSSARSFSVNAIDTSVVVAFLDQVIFDSPPSPEPLSGGISALDLLAPTAASPRLNLKPVLEESPWQLRLALGPGSLDAALNSLRLRNLATGLGVCLVLAAGIAFLILTIRRSQQLAKLQSDFVAGFSHELRTPITAVCMLAENLSDGIPSEPAAVRHYGSLLPSLPGTASP